MPSYICKTMTSAGTFEVCEIEAISEERARAELKNQGKVVLKIRESKVAQKKQSTSGRRPSLDEVASTMRQMAILIRAGVPLVESLSGLSEHARSQTLRDALSQLATAVSHGTALSDAFTMQRKIFPPIAAEMARIAEAGGNLYDAIARLAEHLERDAEIRRKIKSALAYPIVVLAISGITVIALVTFIMPRFMSLFDKIGAKVPLTTKVLMGISHFSLQYWYLFVVGIPLTAYVIGKFAQTPKAKRKIDSLVLRLPIFGDLISKIVLSRVLASIGTLVASGVPLVQALEASAQAANNEIVKDALSDVKSRVSEGKEISQAMSASNVFPPLVVQMVASGEKTGELPTMLAYICELYNQEADAKMRSLTSIMEPVLIVILGGIVGFIAISVILPIYSLVGGVK